MKEVVKFGKKIFNSNSKIIFEKKKFYESENLSLDSSKSFKLLKWRTRFFDKEALKMAFEWYKSFYKTRKKIEILNLSFAQINLFRKKHKI